MVCFACDLFCLFLVPLKRHNGLVVVRQRFENRRRRGAGEDEKRRPTEMEGFPLQVIGNIVNLVSIIHLILLNVKFVVI
jgi:hypothetical protein